MRFLLLHICFCFFTAEGWKENFVLLQEINEIHDSEMENFFSFAL